MLQCRGNGLGALRANLVANQLQHGYAVARVRTCPAQQHLQQLVANSTPKQTADWCELGDDSGERGRTLAPQPGCAGRSTHPPSRASRSDSTGSTSSCKGVREQQEQQRALTSTLRSGCQAALPPRRPPRREPSPNPTAQPSESSFLNKVVSTRREGATNMPPALAWSNGHDSGL